MKLVVTDGGNVLDHGTWGDAKLHFANDVQGDYGELEPLVHEVKDYEQDIYIVRNLLGYYGDLRESWRDVSR